MTGSSGILDNVLKILDGLKKTAEGRILHSLIARGMRKFGDTRVERAFLAFAEKLLERYLANPESDPATRIKVRVIQQRLRPYLEELLAIPLPEPAAPTATVDAAKTRAATPEIAVTAAPAPAPTPVPEPKPLAAAEPEAPYTAQAAPAAGDSLPEQLARQMAETLTHGRDLDELLRSSLAALERSGAAAELDGLKHQLRHGIEELIAERHTLERDLSDTRRGLKAIAEDRHQLAQQLDRARKHSLTDELTGLPNRSAFLRQLNAEIGRARRYGFSLALALIDVDDLKQVNERYGQAAGDAVLHAYANEIMTQFRGYDLVARYGEDEFVVLLPNTQKEGATRAVEKAQKRAADTYIHFDGRNIPLPSFSSVLTLYAHGEPPATLLKRADEALGHAKQRGRAQAVVALPAG